MDRWLRRIAESPIAVNIGGGGEPDFTERALAALDTIEFESVGPNPIPAEGNLWELGISRPVPAGPVTLPPGPGVMFETTTETFIFQDTDFAAIGTDGPFESDLVFPSTNAAGEAIVTTDDVLAALGGADGVEVETTGTRIIDGREATVVSFTGSPGGPDVQPVFPIAENRWTAGDHRPTESCESSNSTVGWRWPRPSGSTRASRRTRSHCRPRSPTRSCSGPEVVDTERLGQGAHPGEPDRTSHRVPLHRAGAGRAPPVGGHRRDRPRRT